MRLKRFSHASGRRRRGPGQALVEFALVFPVFLLATMGVVDMARVFMAQITITNGVREAAIYAGYDHANVNNVCSAATTIVVANPPGCVSSNQNTDPDNLARRIQNESQGLPPSSITLLAPICKNNTSSGATVIACSSVVSGSQVTISARVQVTFLTPILSNIVGTSVTVSASTSVAVIQ